MTASLKWRSQLCPCGFCPDGTRIEWRYSIDIRFRPRRRVSGGTEKAAGADEPYAYRKPLTEPKLPAAANPSGPPIGFAVFEAPLRARTRNVRKALEGP